MQKYKFVEVPVVIANKPGGGQAVALAYMDQHVTRAMGLDVKKLKTVVFQTNAQGITAIMGGHVDVVALSLAAAMRAVKAGQVRVIGISSERRSEGPAADIPTWKEQGLDVVFSNVRFSIGPKGLSPAQTAYWDGVFGRLIQTEEWKNEVRQNDWVLDYAGSKQAPPRMAKPNGQLKAALSDAGLVQE